jgi:hypothetical protein
MSGEKKIAYPQNDSAYTADAVSLAIADYDKARQRLAEAQVDVHSAKRELVQQAVRIGNYDCLSVNVSKLRGRRR